MDWSTFPTWFYAFCIIAGGIVGLFFLAAFQDSRKSEEYHRKLREHYAEKARQMREGSNYDATRN